MTDHRPPRDDLYRGVRLDAEVRAGEASTPTLVGHFARFDSWNEIDSVFEGRFLERITPGAFKQTFATKRERIRVLFQHGKDPQIGDKPIAVPSVLAEDETGPYYEAELLDAGYVRDLIPGLRAGAYGVSYRFRVLKEDFDPAPNRTKHNPLGLPERTIREAEVFEFGPVTFPADPGADVAVRSLTDAYVLDRFASEPARTAEIIGALRSEPAPDAEAEESPHLDDPGRDAEPEPESEPEPEPPPIPEPERKASIVEYVTRDEKAARVRELESELSDLAVEYPGVMPEQAQRSWDEKNVERDALTADIAAWDARQARLAEFAGKPTATRSGSYEVPTIVRRQAESDIYDLSVIDGAGSPEARAQRLRDNAMRAVETAPIGRTSDADAGRAHGQFLLDARDSENKELARRILVTGSPVYRRAFNKYVMGQPLSPEEQRGTALAVQVDATGGFALPFAFDPTIIPIGSHSGWQNPYRQFARVETIVGTDTWQGLTSTAVTATRADEAAAATEQGPTFAQPSAMVTRVQGAVTYSIEMASDRPDIGAELGVLIAEAKDNEEEAAFSTGVGDALGSKVNPLGIFAAHGTSGAYTHVNCASAHTLAIGDLDSLESAVPVRHRARSVWLMNERTLRTVQGLETTGGRLFDGVGYPGVGGTQFAASGNTGKLLLGKPVYITPSATYDVTVDDTPLMWLGAGDSFLVLDRAGINVEYIPHVFADAAGSLPTGQRRLYFWYRNTAKPINTDGGRVLMVLNA